MRTYDDVVEVRQERAAPRQFLWRGRVYVVRDVLSHWYERTAWWDGAAARAALGTADPATGPGVTHDTAGGGPGAEREVWRVQARAGRSATDGVFDLAVTTASPTARPSWHLVRVVD